MVIGADAAVATPASPDWRSGFSASTGDVHAASASSGVRTDLEVNGDAAPLGIESKPKFSWHPLVARQTAYQVQVGDETGSYDAWDSGKVTSSNSTEVAYRGPLESQEDYFWRVRVWGPDGKVSRWSRPASWETGLLRGERDWDGAQWIGGRQSLDHDWSDLTETVRFRGGADPAAGLKLLMRAEPIGKTWGESLSWTVGRSRSATRRRRSRPARGNEPSGCAASRIGRSATS